MPKSLGLRPVPVLSSEENLPLTDKSRMAQATINDNFRILATRVNNLEKTDEENQRPQVYRAFQNAGGSIISALPPASNTPGTNIAFTTESAGAFALVFATWDFEVVAGGFGTALGALWVTGGNYGAGTDVSTPQAIFGIASGRLTVHQVWELDLVIPTSYTVTMYARKTINAGDVITNHGHTNHSTLVFDEG